MESCTSSPSQHCFSGNCYTNQRKISSQTLRAIESISLLSHIFSHLLGLGAIGFTEAFWSDRILHKVQARGMVSLQMESDLFFLVPVMVIQWCWLAWRHLKCSTALMIIGSHMWSGRVPGVLACGFRLWVSHFSEKTSAFWQQTDQTFVNHVTNHSAQSASYSKFTQIWCPRLLGEDSPSSNKEDKAKEAAHLGSSSGPKSQADSTFFQAIMALRWEPPERQRLCFCGMIAGCGRLRKDCLLIVPLGDGVCKWMGFKLVQGCSQYHTFCKHLWDGTNFSSRPHSSSVQKPAALKS